MYEVRTPTWQLIAYIVLLSIALIPCIHAYFIGFENMGKLIFATILVLAALGYNVYRLIHPLIHATFTPRGITLRDGTFINSRDVHEIRLIQKRSSRRSITYAKVTYDKNRTVYFPVPYFYTIFVKRVKEMDTYPPVDASPITAYFRIVLLIIVVIVALIIFK